jgi:hypothetical protein
LRNELTPMEQVTLEAFDAGHDLRGEPISPGITHAEFVRQWLHEVIASRNVIIHRLQLRLAEVDELIAVHQRSIDPRPPSEWPADSAIYRAFAVARQRDIAGYVCGEHRFVSWIVFV